jgi:3-hydroxybutyryl-CoA dehydrogenase
MSQEAGGALRVIGVVGVGAMGRGIAQVAATGGLEVLLFDAATGTAERGRAAVGEQLDRLVEKGRLAAEDAAAAKARLRVVAGIADLAPARVVVEAVAENLAVKHDVFRALEAAVAADAIIASNTSSLRIASIASSCRQRGRIAGLHFFNPVPLMKLVEVIAAPETDPAVVEALVALGRRMGRVPVVVKDGPGFLVNLGGRAYTSEGLRIVHEGAATPAQVDAVMRDCCGFRMGPFELMDLTGIDVNFPVSRIIYEGFFHDRRLATVPLHQSLMESGRLGRKSGAGFYAYDAEGNKIAPSADAASAAAPARRLALAEPDDGLAGFLRGAGAELGPDDRTVPLVAAPVGEDCATLAVRLGSDHRRLVALDLSADTGRRITVMTAPGADTAVRDGVVALLAASGRKVTLIKDSPGFIAQRIRAMVANLGCEMAQIGIAAPADIDRAMTLGLNYPQGPLALADLIGPRLVHGILGTLQAITGDDRYRPSLWLRRRALLGLSALTPE